MVGPSEVAGTAKWTLSKEFKARSQCRRCNAIDVFETEDEMDFSDHSNEKNVHYKRCRRLITQHPNVKVEVSANSSPVKPD